MIHNILYYNGSKINYQCEGKGETTLVLLHGFMHDLRIWAPFVYSYMREIRVVTIDLPGHGESECCDEVHTMELQADVVKAVLDELGIKKCVMAGHSMGGYVALAFAARYSDYLRGLCLVNSHALADGVQKAEDRRRMCRIVKENRAGFIINFIPQLFAECNRDSLDEEIKDLQDYALNTGTEGIIAAQEGMITRKSHVDVLQNSNFPILFIAGREDKRISVDLVIAQASLAPHCEIMLLPNVAHMSHVEAKNIVKQRLLSFARMCFSMVSPL